jgi:hypothetical protein
MSFLANDLRLLDPGVFFLSRGESCVAAVEFGPNEFRGELLVPLPGVNTAGMAAMMDCIVTAPQISHDRSAAEKRKNEVNCTKNERRIVY